MSNEQKINNIGRVLGSKLIQTGTTILSKSFNLNPIIKIKGDFSHLLRSRGITGQSLYDQKYFTIPIEKWKQIITVDLIDQKQYWADHSDCDNFAYLFSARMSMTFGVNTCGVAVGVRTHNGKEVRHAFNIIVSSDNKIWLLETQTDQWAEFQLPQKTELGSAFYSVEWVNFF